MGVSLGIKASQAEESLGVDEIVLALDSMVDEKSIQEHAFGFKCSDTIERRDGAACVAGRMRAAGERASGYQCWGIR